MYKKIFFSSNYFKSDYKKYTPKYYQSISNRRNSFHMLKPTLSQNT